MVCAAACEAMARFSLATTTPHGMTRRPSHWAASRLSRYSWLRTLHGAAGVRAFDLVGNPCGGAADFRHHRRMFAQSHFEPAGHGRDGARHNGYAAIDQAAVAIGAAHVVRRHLDQPRDWRPVRPPRPARDRRRVGEDRGEAAPVQRDCPRERSTVPPTTYGD
jgi:hypothetical protein